MRNRSTSHLDHLDTDLDRLTEALDREFRNLDTVTSVGRSPNLSAPAEVAITAPAGAWVTAAVAIGAAGVWLVTSLPY